MDQSEGPDPDAKKVPKTDANVKLFEFLVYYVNEYDDDNNPIVEMYEPSVFLYGLTIPDLEGLPRSITNDRIRCNTMEYDGIRSYTSVVNDYRKRPS